MYELAYKYIIPPMDGKKSWDDVEGNLVFPPLVKKQPGRPKRKRKIDIIEKEKGHTKLSKKGLQKTCSLCHRLSHNRKSCAKRRMEATGEGSEGGIEPPPVEAVDATQSIISAELQKRRSQNRGSYGVIVGASGTTYTFEPDEPRRTTYMGRFGGQFVTVERGGREPQPQFIPHSREERPTGQQR